jgi:DNA ligase-1
MQAFAALIERLVLTPQRNGKLALLTRYITTTPDPERGWALAAIAGELEVGALRPAAVRALAETRVDAELLALSYDFVGDLAETISLIWPARPGANRCPDLTEVVEALQTAPKSHAPGLLSHWLDAATATERWALIKLITGGFRIGAGARLIRTALAEVRGCEVGEVEAAWVGQQPPYTELLAWIDARGDRPAPIARAPFWPVMLAHPLEAKDIERLDISTFQFEWKYDGARVQAVSDQGERRLYTRSGLDVSHAFPDLLALLPDDATLDGELLVETPEGTLGSFNDLQQRLNRKRPDKALIRRFPARLLAYDLLAEGGNDLRPLPLSHRRARLERLVAAHGQPRITLGPVLSASDWDTAARLRDDAAPGVEGLMLKRADSPYEMGRVRGAWYKWKREAMRADCVMMYAQRGHGKRSGLYSDFTFGVWQDGPDGPTLVPVGKAYSGFTDAELRELDRFVRENTRERFGPVRSVRAEPDFGQVLEVAFEGLARSTRHRSGLAMRFPRIARVRTDKPPREADTLAMLEALLSPNAASDQPG